MQLMKYFIFILTVSFKEAGRHPHKWKQNLIKEAHFIYYTVILATEKFEQSKYYIEN